ncbi:MAG: hypothetical protein MJZ33_01520 [Paludibacteraceae bacterium]|nr:hypothetical protein [Paludibacteraceae bacterium]
MDISSKRKKWKIRHDRKSMMLKVHFKEKRREDFRLGRSRYTPSFLSEPQGSTNYHFLKAPDNFSLVSNENEVLAFIDEINSYYQKKEPVFINMDTVSTLGNGAILLLLANMILFREKGINFNGSKPNNITLRQELETSGFFRHLYKTGKDGMNYTVGTPLSKIYTHAQKEVDTEAADRIIEVASETVWGEKRRCTGVQRTLIELMHNTNNHAGSKKGEKHWWISSNRDQKNQVATISFMDFGMGIFDSLNNKHPGDLFYGWKDLFSKFFPWADSSDKIMKLILEGELHKTCTGKSYRGKGLPGIYSAYKKGKLGKLIIISNRVYADIGNDDFHLMNGNLHGTFISCEINNTIFNLPWV